MNKSLKKLAPYLVGVTLGILSFIPFTRQTTIASFLTGFGSNTVNQWNYFLDYGSESQNMCKEHMYRFLAYFPAQVQKLFIYQLRLTTMAMDLLVIVNIH